jgi:hypothetical protein
MDLSLKRVSALRTRAALYVKVITEWPITKTHLSLGTSLSLYFLFCFHLALLQVSVCVRMFMRFFSSCNARNAIRNFPNFIHRAFDTFSLPGFASFGRRIYKKSEMSEGELEKMKKISILNAKNAIKDGEGKCLHE